MDPVYQESHMVLPKNLAFITAGIFAATLLFMIVYKFVFYPDMPAMAIVCIAISFILVCLVCFLLKFTISVYDDRIEMKYAFSTTSIPLEQIIDTRTGELNIIKNYSDWTLKGVKYKTYSVIGLDLGIGLKVTGKRVFFMSAEDPERIASLLPKEEKE
ncbi:MAG: hypothetical protein E7Z65_02700 [Thermoplasmata archaeon]|nr:hypothetical protein [Thermoplasmata archaeon]